MQGYFLVSLPKKRYFPDNGNKCKVVVYWAEMQSEINMDLDHSLQHYVFFYPDREKELYFSYYHYNKIAQN